MRASPDHQAFRDEQILIGYPFQLMTVFSTRGHRGHRLSFDQVRCHQWLVSGSDKIIVMPAAKIGPLLFAESATGGFLRNRFEIAFAGSTGRKEQQHGARFV